MSPLALFFLVAALRKPIKVLWQAAETWEIMHIDHHKTKFDNIYQQDMHIVLYEMCVFIAINTSYPSKYKY